MFFFLTVFFSLMLMFFDFSSFLEVISVFGKTLGSIVPALALVFLMMFFTNLLVRPETIMKHLGENAGFRKWLIAILGGIISSGPTYLWYPLLADLKEGGMNQSLLAAFLYARAVKIPLMPLMAYYFGWMFVAVFSFCLVFSSIVVGWTVGEIAGKEVEIQ